jgi:hypothetical protein
MTRVLAAVALAGFLAAVGCAGKSDNPSASGSSGGHGHDHDHDGGDKMLEDAGPYHAGLTAHLSEKEGNELDIVIETQEKKNPKPVPLPLTEIVAKAKREGDPKEYELKFVPAEKAERKDDPDGKCSRFTAKAPWMKPDDKLTVTATVEIEKKPRDLVWKNFVPKKFSHHHD